MIFEKQFSQSYSPDLIVFLIIITKHSLPSPFAHFFLSLPPSLSSSLLPSCQWISVDEEFISGRWTLIISFFKVNQKKAPLYYKDGRVTHQFSYSIKKHHNNYFKKHDQQTNFPRDVKSRLNFNNRSFFLSFFLSFFPSFFLFFFFLSFFLSIFSHFFVFSRKNDFLLISDLQWTMECSCSDSR